MTCHVAGSPSRWPVILSHADEPGVAKHHHAGCVMQRVRERDAALAAKTNAEESARDSQRLLNEVNHELSAAEQQVRMLREELQKARDMLRLLGAPLAATQPEGSAE